MDGRSRPVERLIALGMSREGVGRMQVEAFAHRGVVVGEAPTEREYAEGWLRWVSGDEAREAENNG